MEISLSSDDAVRCLLRSMFALCLNGALIELVSSPLTHGPMAAGGWCQVSLATLFVPSSN